MGSVINFKNHAKSCKNSDLNYQKKLCRIRDTIENDLYCKSLIEDDHLAVSLSAGRYAAMKLYQMHGRAETMAFFDSCIQTVEISEDISAK